MLIIGINAYHGDASVAAIVDGRVVAAAEEERFNRVKHSAGFPREALRYVLDAAGLLPGDIECVAVARDPWARWRSKVWQGFRTPLTAMKRLRVYTRFAGIGREIERSLGSGGGSAEIRRVEHHRAHLASSFFVSPFEEAALLSVDGFGDFASAAWGVGRGSQLRIDGEARFPHSLGIYYTALTQYLGFPRYGDEYKVMGLAPYGEPDFLKEFRRMVVNCDSGRQGFRLNTDYFTHSTSGARMTWESGEPILGRLYSDYLVERLGPARRRDQPLDDRYRAIAASAQVRLEEVLIDHLRRLAAQTRLRDLCLAGGVALNCVANGKILECTGFERLFVQPAAGDAGLAVGAAMDVWQGRDGGRRGFVMEHAYWGPACERSEACGVVRRHAGRLKEMGCRVETVSDEDALVRRVARAIAAGRIVGWFQGRMEWGPRALGNRSILADPRRAEMRQVINTRIKRREEFRPFAPSVLAEAAGEYFALSAASPFMLIACPVRPDKRSIVPATTHVDGSSRPQTVSAGQNPRFYKLIREFGRQTGVPVLLNTSFNENEPVVCRPQEALDCFLRTRMDMLVIGEVVISRSLQD